MTGHPSCGNTIFVAYSAASVLLHMIYINIHTYLYPIAVAGISGVYSGYMQDYWFTDMHKG